MFRRELLIAFMAMNFLVFAVEAKEIKIGVVDMAKIMSSAPQADKAERKLKKEFSPRQQQLEKMQKNLISLEENLKKNGSVMSESQRRKKEREILAGRREFKRAQDEFREDVNIRKNEEFIKLRKKINSTLKLIAQKEGYDIILMDGVLYSTKKVDITDKVLAGLKGSAAKK